MSNENSKADAAHPVERDVMPAAYRDGEPQNLAAAALDLYKEAQQAMDLLRHVRYFRLASGSLPFNTVDYYMLDDRIKALESVLQKARGEVSR